MLKTPLLPQGRKQVPKRRSPQPYLQANGGADPLFGSYAISFFLFSCAPLIANAPNGVNVCGVSRIILNFYT